MTDSGWVKLYRDLLDKPIWVQSTTGQKAVLITIIMLANHNANNWEWNGKQFELQPGQFITSSSRLAEKAGRGVTRQIVRSSLTRFQSLGFLTTQSTKDSTLINVVNWGKYQCSKNEATNHTTNRQPTDNQPTTTNKNVRTKDKDMSTSKELVENFEKLWKLYPRKEGKKPAFAAYKRAMTRKVNPATNKQIQNGIVAYSKELQAAGTEMQFIKQGSTFFSQEAWQDYTAIAEQQEAAKPKFNPDQWVLDTFSVYGSISQVLREIQDNGVPVDPERAKQLITEHLSSLGRDAASYS